jgi:translation elongation factor EF-Ts
VLVEVNCETDFVGRGDQFRELVSDIAMQVRSQVWVTALQHDSTYKPCIVSAATLPVGLQRL